jgi:hypothetical protein
MTQKERIAKGFHAASFGLLVTTIKSTTFEIMQSTQRTISNNSIRLPV